jgi:Domain of unknown function (DUF4920)
MKNIVVSVFILFLIVSCNGNKKTVVNTVKVGDYTSIGAKIIDDKVISKEEMLAIYASMKEGDTVAVKFKSSINDVCQNKGCWMKLDLSDKKETFVKFKDYGFFMPLDSKNAEVIVNGKAFVSIESVADQKHYAKDAGKSKEEIAKITTPKSIFSFLADGVLLKQ